MPVTHIRAGPAPDDEAKFTGQSYSGEVSAVFERVSHGLATIQGRQGMTETMALIDLFDPNLDDFVDLHAAGSRCEWVRVVCMLVLAYPEVHWVFLTPYPAAGIISSPDLKLAGEARLLAACHLLRGSGSLVRILDLVDAGYQPLFDPTCLRHSIRERMKATEPKEEDLRYLRSWLGRGAAVDEEAAYAYFNAYVLYRFGLVALAITRYRLMQAAFGEDQYRLTDEVPDGVLEDIYLTFADRPVHRHFSELGSKDRAKEFPQLQKVRRRSLVTVGRGGGASRVIWQRNRRYLAHRRTHGYQSCVLYKPGGGIFELWRRSGLAKLVRKRQVECAQDEATRGAGRGVGHSAPGRLLLIAECLIARARLILAQAGSVEEAVHAATLVVDARALLGGRTPTTSLEAVAVQHEAEVLAESLFIGIQYNLDVRTRIRSVRRDVEEVARRFQAIARKRASLSAQLTIIERLARRFHDLNQIEEELACLGEARRLRFEFWVRERWWRWAVWPLLRYLAFSLHSLPRFAVVVVAWTLLFGLSYYIVGNMQPAKAVTFWDALAGSSRFFFTAESSAKWASLPGREGFWDLWLGFQGLISFTSLGLLLSHLYLIVSRR